MDTCVNSFEKGEKKAKPEKSKASKKIVAQSTGSSGKGDGFEGIALYPHSSVVTLAFVFLQRWMTSLQPSRGVFLSPTQ